MATLTRPPSAGPRRTRPRDRTRIPRLEPARTTQTGRERTLAEARAREARARRNLGLALARAEQTYAQALRNLEEFDEYLRVVRARLDHAGYLSSAEPSADDRRWLEAGNFEEISFGLDLAEPRVAT